MLMEKLKHTDMQKHFNRESLDTIETKPSIDN